MTGGRRRQRKRKKKNMQKILVDALKRRCKYHTVTCNSIVGCNWSGWYIFFCWCGVSTAHRRTQWLCRTSRANGQFRNGQWNREHKIASLTATAHAVVAINAAVRLKSLPKNADDDYSASIWAIAVWVWVTISVSAINLLSHYSFCQRSFNWYRPRFSRAHTRTNTRDNLYIRNSHNFLRQIKSTHTQRTADSFASLGSPNTRYSWMAQSDEFSQKLLMDLFLILLCVILLYIFFFVLLLLILRPFCIRRDKIVLRLSDFVWRSFASQFTLRQSTHTHTHSSS